MYEVLNALEKHPLESERLVEGLGTLLMWRFESCVAWDCSAKLGGRFHLKLNICRKPIVYKYREGKMKSTLRRGLREPEIDEEEAYGLAYCEACKRVLQCKGVHMTRLETRTKESNDIASIRGGISSAE